MATDIGCDDQAAVFFIPVNCDDIIDQSDGSLQNSELATQWFW